MASKLVSLN